MPGLLIGVRHGTPLFYEKPTVAFNSLHFQAPMQCKLWDNRVQAIAELCLFNSIPLTSSHCLFSPFSAVCVVVLWSCWPPPCVFTFGSDLSSATSGEPNTNWTVTVHRPRFGRGRSAGPPSQLPGCSADPWFQHSLGTWLPIKLPPQMYRQATIDEPKAKKASGGRQTSRKMESRPRENTGREQIANVWVVCFVFSQLRWSFH